MAKRYQGRHSPDGRHTPDQGRRPGLSPDNGASQASASLTAASLTPAPASATSISAVAETAAVLATRASTSAARAAAKRASAKQPSAPPARRAPAFATPVALSRALRRPLASAAAVAAVAGATAAGFASVAKPHTAVASFTPSPAAVAQAAELSDSQTDTDASLAEARRAGVQRASALTQQHTMAAQEKAAAFARARATAAERAAREQARAGILARAQSNPRAVARLLVADRGWPSAQFTCLDSLWAKESGWRWNADNASSDAYGIPQALPGSKMASFGSDWATNPITQIKWGLQYISGRYGTPCAAWAQSQASNWY